MIALVFGFVLFLDRLDNFGEDRTDYQVLHEAAVLEHGRAALEVAAFDLDVVAADAARWLLHM